MKIFRLVTSVCIAMAGQLGFASEKSWSLMEFLREAERRHPELESAHWREEVAEAQLQTSSATLLPTLEVGPLITRGEPGGSTVNSWNGNIGASMRSGQGVAGLIRYTAWDFGRTSSAVRAGVADLEAARAEHQRIQGELLLNLAQEYLECSGNRNLLGLLVPLEKETTAISETIEKLVKTGQRTLVEEHLARAQTLEVKTQIEVAQERVRFHQKRLGAYVAKASVSCLDLDALSATEVNFASQTSGHPVVVAARARNLAAAERVGSAYSDRNPRLQLLGNGGYFDSPFLATPWNYSFSAALVIPIWDLKMTSEIHKAEAAHLQAESDLKASELRIDTALISAEERYRVSEARLRSLELENSEAILGFEIALKRYQTSVGLLYELRETVRNLIRVSSAVAGAKTELLSAKFFLKWYRLGRKGAAN